MTEEMYVMTEEMYVIFFRRFEILAEAKSEKR